MPIPGRYDRALFWFRRDLRDYDNAGLCHALESSRKVFCAFIFDREILDELPSSADRRVEFIWESVNELRTALENLGGSLIVRHARLSEAIPRLASELKVNAVFTNDDPMQHTRRAPEAASTPSRHLGWLRARAVPLAAGMCRPQQKSFRVHEGAACVRRDDPSRDLIGHISQPRADLP